MYMHCFQITLFVSVTGLNVTRVVVENCERVWEKVY